MSRTVLDAEGRVRIPEEIQERLQLTEGTEFEVRVEDNTIVLDCCSPGIQRVRAGRDWGTESFFNAGEALFGGDHTDTSLMDESALSDPVDAIVGMLSTVDTDSVSLQESIGERHRCDLKRDPDEE